MSSLYWYYISPRSASWFSSSLPFSLSERPSNECCPFIIVPADVLLCMYLLIYLLFMVIAEKREALRLPQYANNEGRLPRIPFILPPYLRAVSERDRPYLLALLHTCAKINSINRFHPQAVSSAVQLISLIEAAAAAVLTEGHGLQLILSYSPRASRFTPAPVRPPISLVQVRPILPSIWLILGSLLRMIRGR